MRTVLLTSAILLASCSAAQQAKLTAFEAKTQSDIQAVVAKAYATGQLFCQFATSKGPAIVGVVNAAVTIGASVADPLGGNAIALPIVSVINQSSAWVIAACQKAADAFPATVTSVAPVPPPADPTTAPLVAIVPPPA